MQLRPSRDTVPAPQRSQVPWAVILLPEGHWHEAPLKTWPSGHKQLAEAIPVVSAPLTPPKSMHSASLRQKLWSGAVSFPFSHGLQVRFSSVAWPRRHLAHWTPPEATPVAVKPGPQTHWRWPGAASIWPLGQASMQAVWATSTYWSQLSQESRSPAL